MTKATLSLEGFVPYRLSLASNASSGLIAASYEALFGIRLSEGRLLAVLAEREPLSQKALAAATRMDKVAVSRATRTLLKKNLIARRVDPSDRRAQVVTLCEAGRLLFEQMAPKALEIEARVFACLSAAERETLVALLLRIEKATAETASATSLERRLSPPNAAE